MNKLLMKQIIDKIEEKPKQWNQNVWHEIKELASPTLVKEVNFCNTSHCIAGWAFVLDNINKGKDWFGDNEDKLGERIAIRGINNYAVFAGISWDDIGCDLLDLDAQQSDYLFDPDRTLEEIKEFYESDGDVPADWDD